MKKIALLLLCLTLVSCQSNLEEDFESLKASYEENLDSIEEIKVELESIKIINSALENELDTLNVENEKVNAQNKDLIITQKDLKLEIQEHLDLIAALEGEVLNSSSDIAHQYMVVVEEDFIFVPEDHMLKLAPTTDSLQVAMAQSGTLATVIDKVEMYSVDDEGRVAWYYIQIPNYAEPQNQKGWIKGEYVQPYSDLIRSDIRNVATQPYIDITWQAYTYGPEDDQWTYEIDSYDCWIDDKVGDYYRLTFSGGRSGWVHKTDLMIRGIDDV